MWNQQIKKILAYRTADVEYRALTPKIVHLIEQCLLPSWWVVFFLLFCYMAYEQSLKTLNQEMSTLRGQYTELQTEKRKAMTIQADSLLQINSQSDQDWVELTLMKGLGLVPEDQIKVFFTEKE